MGGGNIVMDGDTLIDKRIGEVLDLEVDSRFWKKHFKPIFIVLMDHKVTFCKVEMPHILNGIDTLGT